MVPAITHLHKRKRIYQKHEPYPHPNKWKRLVDDLAYGAGIIIPIVTIPQAWRIWAYETAAGGFIGYMGNIPDCFFDSVCLCHSPQGKAADFHVHRADYCADSDSGRCLGLRVKILFLLRPFLEKLRNRTAYLVLLAVGAGKFYAVLHDTITTVDIVM